MRKYLLLAVAALLVFATTWAEQQPQTKPLQYTATKVVKHQQPQRPLLKTTDAKPASSLLKRHAQKPLQQQAPSVRAKSHQPMASARKAMRRAATEVITEQPEGTVHNMVYSSSYYGYSFFGLYSGQHDAAFSQVVEGTDGSLYIHNMLTELNTELGYWVKAEKHPTRNNTYVIHRQPIYVEEYFGTTYVYDIAAVDVTPDASVVPYGNGDITVTWRNQTLTSNNIIGALDAVDDGWAGCLNYDIRMAPQTDVAITELPTGVEPFEVAFTYMSALETEETSGDDGDDDDYDDYDDYYTIEPTKSGIKTLMAIDGNNIYLKPYVDMDSWVKGVIDGETATFASRQYMGVSEEYGQHVYFMAANAALELTDGITFAYDAANRTLTNSDAYAVINGGKAQLYYISLLAAPQVTPFVDRPATPAAPENLMGENYNTRYGYGYISFTAPCFDVDGNLLDVNKMSYKVYMGYDYDEELDDFKTKEPVVFSAEDYFELTEDLTEIPFTLQDNFFWTNGTEYQFVHFFNRAAPMGIQVIYRGGGEEHESEIIWTWDQNGVNGSESVFPLVENPIVNTESLAAGEMVLKMNEPSYAFETGSGKAETYDVAIHVADDPTLSGKLTGKKVAGISIPFFSVEGISHAKAWVATSLQEDADGNFTTVASADFTPAEQGFTTVRFATPVEIPENGIYIGYSLTQAEAAEMKPIVLTDYSNGAFLIRSSKVFRTGWASMINMEGDLAIEAILTDCDENAGEVARIADVHQLPGVPSTTKMHVVNYGTKGLRKLDYDYELLEEGTSIKGSATLEGFEVAPVFGGYTVVEGTIPAADNTGFFIYYVHTKKANDVDLKNESYEAQCNVIVVSSMPKKRPLMEEYTGTWCGYCPRGFVALEKMAELYPEDFVALSYHNSDPMEVMPIEMYPSLVEGFPAAWLDREWEIDAYYGTGFEDFGIEATWKERSAMWAPADIDVEAAWSEDGNSINVKSTVTFAEPISYPNIYYAVVADGLTGTTDDWAQHNYFSGDNMLYMEQFTQGEDVISGLVFNDVVIAVSGNLEGLVPEDEEIVTGKAYTHEFSFDASAIVNTAGEPLIQDKTKLKVVAALTDWDVVENANKCSVTGTNVGIADRMVSPQVAKTTYYDLSGRRVLVPSTGVYVRTQLMKDGSIATSKVMVK